MSEDQFMKLLKYVEETRRGVAEIKENMANMATKEDIRNLTTIIDGYAAKLETYAVEMAAMQHKIDRLERMIDYLADKAGIGRSVLEAL